MAKKKERTEIPQSLFVGLGVAVGAGSLILLLRALRPPVVALAEGVDAVGRGVRDAAEAVADAIFGATEAAEISARTNAIIAQATAQIATAETDLERARLSLVRLEAAKAEAVALGQPFGLQPSIDIVRGRIAALEAGFTTEDIAAVEPRFTTNV